MTTAQPDKTGLHILLKLAALVVILAGIHAAADIIVQLLLALFCHCIESAGRPVYSPGSTSPGCHYARSGSHAVRPHGVDRRPRVFDHGIHGHATQIQQGADT